MYSVSCLFMKETFGGFIFFFLLAFFCALCVLGYLSLISSRH